VLKGKGIAEEYGMRRGDALNWLFSWWCVVWAGWGQPVGNVPQLLKPGCELELFSTSSWRADGTFRFVMGSITLKGLEVKHAAMPEKANWWRGMDGWRCKAV